MNSMLYKIDRPLDNYSPLWAKYWEQNPSLLKGVGSDAVGDEETAAAAAKAADDAKNAEWQSKFDTLTADNERLTAKISESNKHTKAAEAKAAKEEKERLEGANNFEQSTSEENAALTLANELTKDTKRARLLAKELKIRLKYTDDGIKVTDANGNLTVSSLADLKLEVQKNPDYDFLIDGVDSSGGSASGSNKTGSASRTYTRAEFAALNPAQKMQVSKDARSGKAELID
jgi:hypothetical protein